MSEDFDKYLAIANQDIQRASNHNELKSYVASILYSNDEKDKEIERLNNIINELEKWIIENDRWDSDYVFHDFDGFYGIKPDYILDKIKELKENKDENNRNSK